MLKTSGFVARSVDELKDRITGETAFRPTLAFIFSSVKLGLPDMAKALSTINVPVFGSSAGGEILTTPTDLPVHEQSAVCCLLDMPPSYFSLRLFERNNEPPEEFGRRIGKWGTEQFSKPAFIITISNVENNGEAIVKALESVCPKGTIIHGGFAGDNSVPKKTCVFTNTGHSYDGAMVIVFDQSKVTVRGICTSGWASVGADMVVTSSEGPKVYTINGRPALDVMKEYLNVSDNELLPVSLNFPLLLKTPDGAEVLRALFAADFTRRSLKFAGNIPQGAKVTFTSSFGKETIETAIRDFTTFHPRQPEADLLLLFSCLARHRAAGPMVNDEILAASNLWKCPLIGFFACGEIGTNRFGHCEFYNVSLSLVLIHVGTGTP